MEAILGNIVGPYLDKQDLTRNKHMARNIVH